MNDTIVKPEEFDILIRLVSFLCFHEHVNYLGVLPNQIVNADDIERFILVSYFFCHNSNLFVVLLVET